MARSSWSTRVAFSILLLSSLSAAWPRWLPELDALVVRQNGGSSSSQTSGTSAQQTSAASSATNSQASQTTSTDNGFQATTGNLNTGGLSPTGTKSAGNQTFAPTHTQFPDTDPAGNVVMVTPAATLGSQLYKIGDNITWAWNYTNLLAPPTAIDVLVTISSTQVWTLTQNMTFSTDGAFTWDTHDYAATAVGTPLLTDLYTLVIYDAQSAVTAQGEAGYLAPYEGFQFGMYQTQTYTPLPQWVCATCNAAISDTERRVLGFALTMSIITVLSFTWFVTGLGGII